MNKELIKMDAIEDIIETLDYFTGYYCDLHNEVFNTDYYIIGTYEAKKALEEYDIWDAIEKVQTYEKDNFGEVNTDLSDPEKLINMLYYIIDEGTANRLKRSTNELIFYSNKLDLYILGVTHYGTAWDYVDTEFIF